MVAILSSIPLTDPRGADILNSAPGSEGRMQLDRSKRDLEQKVERLTRELEEARQAQTATADVLKIISRSTLDLQAVVEVLIGNVTRLAGASRGCTLQFDCQHA